MIFKHKSSTVLNKPKPLLDLTKTPGQKLLSAIQKLKAKKPKKTLSTEKLKKIRKNHTRRSDLGEKIPKTCAESPVDSMIKKPSKRLASCESQRVINSFKIAKPTLKKLKSKDKIKRPKCKISVKSRNVEDMVISPIKKVRLEFLNIEDQSMLKVLGLYSDYSKHIL
ncbi:hypothetical protein SteCoe_24996 [Stentor coeruleus]|uniref:Uncharacterized protein n=1 Tax=Stentor coeruleus TaxID=5963 RepID=A0A1R2BG80_9CILI|nr:hypothetical protein SteCoe_24996 [Stentor coeruleus]